MLRVREATASLRMMVPPRTASILLACSVACGAPTVTSPSVTQQPSRLVATPVPLDGAAGMIAYSGYHEAARIVIRSDADWRSAWATLHAGSSPVPPVPPVDFSREMVLLAALGDRPSGGFGVAIREVTFDGSTVGAAVVETRPGPRCIVTAVVTQPVAVVTVPRSDVPVVFLDRAVTADCG